MDLRKIFGFKLRDRKPYEYSDVIHLWEDDYLMIEFLPIENLKFLENETKKIDDFGKEHFDGNGYTDITPIGEKPVKTIDKKIQISKVEKIFIEAGLNRVNRLVMQDVGLLEGEKVPLGYGSNNFAIFIEGKTDYIENLWLTGHITTDDERCKLKNGLKEFGRQFDFLGVNWNKTEFYNLTDEIQIEEFIKTIANKAFTL